MDDDLHISLSSLELSDFPSAKIKIEQLFNDWLSVEGEDLIDSLSNRQFALHDQQILHQLTANPKVPSISLNAIEPPQQYHGGPPRSPSKKSPKKRTQSEMQSISPSNRSSSSSVYTFDKVGTFPPSSGHGDDDLQTSSSRRRSNFDSIPKFFVRGRHDRSFAHRIEEDQLVNRLPEIEAFFQTFPASGVPVEKFVHVTKKLCGIPSFFNLPLCRRINELYGPQDASRPLLKTAKRQTQGVVVTLKNFLQYWQAEVEPYNRVERFFRTIKQPSADYICKDDFGQFITELLHFHPGLDFLESHEEFQRKYALTVVARIFYKVNTSRTGKISLREVRVSNMFHEFMHVDEETDINMIREYFSYEHFYVLYCRFFELDADKDSKLTKEDLMKYADGSLSPEIIDRILKVGSRAFTDGLEGGFDQTGMNYQDFVVFMLAEEDKSSITSLKYWFTCCDLDGDGRITPEEMWHFYRSQLHRVTSIGQEPILFQDVLCQMIDFICPVNPRSLTIEDFIKPDKKHISGVLFDVLFNLNKFLRFETRDPFQEKQKREDSFACDWDRFAHMEYHRLAAEEEGGGGGGDGNYDMGNDGYGSDTMVGNMDVDVDAGAKSSWDHHDEGDDYDDYDIGGNYSSQNKYSSGSGSGSGSGSKSSGGGNRRR